MSDVDTKVRRRNKRWPVALKREIVAASIAPGASVWVVARQTTSTPTRCSAGVAAIARRSSHRHSRYRRPGSCRWTITPGRDDEGASPPAPTTSETIEIEVAGDYRVRVGSGFDGRTLKRVLYVLRKR
jgi:transposase-like protein